MEKCHKSLDASRQFCYLGFFGCHKDYSEIGIHEDQSAANSRDNLT